jgi:Ca2+-transporting ATPase
MTMAMGDMRYLPCVRVSTTGAPGATIALTPDAHCLTSDDVLERLGSARSGLATAEARRRLERHGPNLLKVTKPASAWKILLDQVRSVVVLLLVVAAGVALLSGDALDAAAIGAVLVLNTALGFVTEIRARRAMEALLALEAPHALVVRDGRRETVDARDLVPGDVLALEEGQAIAADARLLATHDLRTDEAALTGESQPVDKRDAPDAPESPLPERRSMIYKGTAVVAGTGRAVVVATGMDTELGRIGGLVGGLAEERTPLERRLDALGRRLVVLALGVAVVVVALNALRGLPLGLLLQAGIALAIAAVPESLPAVATIALAVGVHRMARRQALVRRLPSVETLGSVTVICTDKTGTLTAGEMTVTTVWTGGRELEVAGVGYEPAGSVRDGSGVLTVHQDPALEAICRIALLANRARLRRTEDGRWAAHGDPTEAALLVMAGKGGLDRDRTAARWREVDELPFSSTRMLMATFNVDESERVIAHVKGAPGRVLERCDTMLGQDGVRPLDERTRQELLERNRSLAGRALRVLALAYGPVTSHEEDALRGLTFAGFVGMIDPPAPGVRETLDTFRTARIRTVMLTGDQQLTAEAIARDLGILHDGDEVLNGRELPRLDDEALARRVAQVAAFSRVSPEDKLRIVAAYQQSGGIVAMLGDGVNDAAALKKADVGLSMGMRGTDVAKEASDVVLEDDRFATIGSAIEEGRVIFDNIRKFVFYLFSCNLAEILVLLAAGVAGLPLPLLPLQILWLNLVTDTFPALALALEPAEPGIMRRAPRDPRQAILSASFLRSVGVYALLIALPVVALYAWAVADPATTHRHAMTLTFMGLALAQLFHLGNARGRIDVLSPARALANRYAIAAVVLVLVLQLLAVYAAPLASVLGTVPLTPRDWLMVVPVAVLPALVGQAMKRARRPRSS